MKKVITNLFLLFSAGAFAQQDITLKNIVPPSPEASAFAKYGTYPIGTYTGKPDISVPIYEINTGKLSVPISLSYDAAGIRVNDRASWVGLNWSLNAGGVVSKMVVGQEDNFTAGWYGVPPRASEIVDNSTYFSYLESIAEQVGPTYDGEPDKFFYSLPNGMGGSFVLDRNRNVMQIPKTSNKISFNGIVVNITDETGVTYVFNVYETTETYINSASGSSPSTTSNGSTYKNQKTAYYLSEIISSDGNDHVYFTYENEYTSSKDDSYSEYFGEYHQNSVKGYNHHHYYWTGVKRVISIPRLKTISFSNGKVEFARVLGRQDDEPTSSRLDEIIVYQKTSSNTYNKLKSFKFIHNYYYSSGPTATYTGFPYETMDRYRLRLDALKLKDAVGNEISSYTFSYNGTELPPKVSCSQDWWGYYNGATNSTLVPTTTIPVGSTGMVTIGGANRSANENFMKAGILEKITYPTGGYTVFDLESHKLHKETSWVGDGATAYAQGNTSNNLVVQTFTVPSSVNYKPESGRLSITIGPHSSGYPQPFVKIKNMSTGQEQTFTSPDMTQWYSYYQYYNFTPGVTYQITASCYVNQSYAIANISASFQKSIYDPHLELIGGLRVKSIKNYGSDNTLANEEQYKYGPGENGGGVFVGINGDAYSHPRAIKAYFYIWTFCTTDMLGGAKFLSGPVFDPAMVQGSPVVYTDVVKYYGNTTTNIGKTVYSYGTAEQQLVTTQPLPAGQQLANNIGFIIINDAWKKGKLIKQEEYKRNTDNSYTLVQSNENSYNIFNTDTTYGLFAQTKFDRLVTYEACLLKYFSDYAWAEYPVRTGYVQLAQTIKKDYSSGSSDIVQTTINHTYDNTRKDIETITTTTNSKGQTIQSEKKYPFHKAQLLTSITSAESTALDDMVTKNMLFPVEEIQRNGSTQMVLKKTSYEYVNSTTIAPVNVRYQNKSNPIETRIQFTKYDASGNLVEQSKADDVSKTYIWGYNKMYPVAEVIGASHTSVMAILSQSVLDNPSDDAAMRTELNKIRTSFPSAQVATYTYRPHVGITSQTDVLNRTTYFYYDPFGRLTLVKDKDGNIVKKLCYNYLGQPGNCALYGNAAKSGSYTKNNCSSGTGTSVTYTVPQNTFYATTQVDADALAQNDVNANGQAYANANGTCSAPQATVYVSNSTNDAYYLNFYNTSTYQNYGVNLNPWDTPTMTIPEGTYTVSITPSGSNYPTYFYALGYSTYGTYAYFSNVSVSGTSNFVSMGD